eukprot:CAMPEP_0194095478 /NCGR_PEP_ID=MMETSP0149-20130528/56847_1 /TAXON_ID=122233 /ORGANISM="Chaetoceros debilis, Strain MM31A-1" /LENGTH=699 /DNA_ID=CAMNT_0038781423 /DNA_START=588 /DNA_END=2684 /DNA_ORIENTATION=-
MKTTIRPLALGMASAAAIFLITYVSIQMATNSTSTTSANTSIDNNLPPEASSILLLPTKKAKAGHDILSSTSPACINDSAFFHGSVAKQTCAWIASRQDRVLSFCQSEAVRSNCPQVCGICCVDAPDFKFELNRGGAVLIEKTCLWLKRKEVRQERYCDDEIIKNACPSSCGNTCPNYVPIVKTKNAGPSSTCTDNKYYSMSGGGRKKTCHWMGLDDTRRSLFCQSEEVRNNCPFSCGECCEDDVQYTFTVKRGLQKKCKWLGQKTVRQERYCNVVMDDHGSAVSAGCPAACGTCKSPYDETSDDDCGDTKATKAPGKGGKGIKSPTSQKNIAGKKAPKQGSKGKGGKYTNSPKSGTKSPKQGSKGKGKGDGKGKGKGSRCTKAPTHTPTNSPIVLSQTPSKSPSHVTNISPTSSESPTSSPSDAFSFVFSVDICTPGCDGISQSEHLDLVKAKILQYALGNTVNENINVNINAESTDCVPCVFNTTRRNRHLQKDVLLLASSAVIEITTPLQDAFEPTTAIENLNNKVQNINDDIAEITNTTVVFQGEFEDATKQPTQSPTKSSLLPSQLPSEVRSQLPSSEVSSQLPSEVPSQLPSEVLSQLPTSEVPSQLPSEVPSQLPVPTATPTPAPTLRPTPASTFSPPKERSWDMDFFTNITVANVADSLDAELSQSFNISNRAFDVRYYKNDCKSELAHSI